ncbi:hypothetical protein B1987_13040 [Mycobacterium kansasii]|uniref:Uncharacterized protein n=1 Tax=Mycobacterium attenuatum TaxID=2341086 RepID=A0A498QFT1_9MYCO|nr:hypothetical protein [Mycobacterium attenuatum]ORB84564.1 hypothetical protein B1987_13040 [Mycobacterium kansasii]VBA43693.1 hypothetical protein LAUMK136_05232 [Mycobacterium attenuatum]
MAGDEQAKITRLVTVNGDHRTLNEARIARARGLVGLKGYVTNTDAAQMSTDGCDRQIPRALAR